MECERARTDAQHDEGGQILVWDQRGVSNLGQLQPADFSLHYRCERLYKFYFQPLDSGHFRVFQRRRSDPGGDQLIREGQQVVDGFQPD